MKWEYQIIMRSLKVLFLSFILSCTTAIQENMKIAIDINLQNFKKHLEISGRNVNLDFIFLPKDGKPKTFSTKKKLSKDEYLFLEERLKNMPWEKIKDRYVSKDAIMTHLPPFLISISYEGKSKNIIIIGDVPKELDFLFEVLNPYLQFDFSMLR